MITNFYAIFKQKYDKQYSDLKTELEKPYHTRDRKKIKMKIRDVRKLRKYLKDLENEIGIICPHCGGDISNMNI